MEPWKRHALNYLIGFGVLIPAIILFSLLQVGFAFLLDEITNFELNLFLETFAILSGLIAVSVWLFSVGKLIGSQRCISWGKRILVVYLVASIAPYLFSFLVTPDA